MAGFQERRQLPRRRNASRREQGSVLLRSCHWFSGQLHPAGEGCGSLLQVLRRVFGEGSRAGTHDRVWRLVDVENSETAPSKEIVPTFLPSIGWNRKSCSVGLVCEVSARDILYDATISGPER